MIVLGIALATMLAQAPRPGGLTNPGEMMLEAPHTRMIEKGDQSNIDEARRELVRTDAEWTTLWKQHHPDKPRPAIDFSKEMVVCVFMGSRPNAGFSTTIISATAANGVLIVRYAEKVPAPGSMSAQILTSPFHLVAIPKAAVTDVKFEKDK
jgi:hypothetical protein